MRILCNLPLECFDEREAMAGIELVTFGPPDRMLVDGVHYRFDVAFDPSRQTYEQLTASLPAGFAPDLVLIYWPDQEPLPLGLERCPVPVVGVVSDYNLTLPYLATLWPFFDSLLCDRNGQELFQRLTFADVRYWCQYAHKRPVHKLWPDATRLDIDIGFAGNLNPSVQRERAPWLDRVRALNGRGIRAEVCTGVLGADYGRFLNRCRLGFNRSIRGEMNLRAFEVPACGALLLMERENLEVRDFFVPGEECVLYGDDDFEDVVQNLIGDPQRTARIAAAGYRRVQDHRLANRLHELQPLANGALRRPASDELERALGRTTALLATWADGEVIGAAAMATHRLAPDDPRTLNLLGLASLRWRGIEAADDAFKLWQRAVQVSTDYLPAVVNLAALLQSSGEHALIRAVQGERERRLSQATSWLAVDGLMLPLGFEDGAIDRSLALQDAVRLGQPAPFASTL